MRVSLAILGAAVLSTIPLPSRAYVKTYTARAVYGQLVTALYIESNRCPRYTLMMDWFKAQYPLPGSFCAPMPMIDTTDFSYKGNSSCSSGYSDIGYGLCLRSATIRSNDNFRESIKDSKPFEDIFAGARKKLKRKPPTPSSTADSSQPPQKRQELSLATINRRKAFWEDAQNKFLSGNFDELLSMSDQGIENDPSYSKVW